MNKFFLYCYSIDFGYVRMVQKHLNFQRSDERIQIFLYFFPLYGFYAINWARWFMNSHSDFSLSSSTQQISYLKLINIYYWHMGYIFSFDTIVLCLKSLSYTQNRRQIITPKQRIILFILIPQLYPLLQGRQILRANFITTARPLTDTPMLWSCFSGPACWGWSIDLSIVGH